VKTSESSLIIAVLIRLCLWSVILLGMATSLWAQQPDVVENEAPAGIDLLIEVKAAAEAGQRAQEHADEEKQARDRARSLEIGRELILRQQALENLRSELGIYDPALLEAYSDLAGFYNEIEDYENAVKLFTDALQVARISSGLDSETQLPVLSNLIDLNRKLEAWQEVDDLHELSLHINTRLYPLTDSHYLAYAEIYGNWKLELLRDNLLQQDFRGLANDASDLSEFYERLIVGIEDQPDVGITNLLHLVSDKVQADLALARSVASTPASAFEGLASRFITQTRCQNVRTTSGAVVRQCYNVQVENPRYRQSQRDAKRSAMNRHTRDIVRSIERLETIRATTTELSAAQLRELDNQIVQLQTQSEQFLRAERRLLL
jgi:tetratricopeptide (TPR) repeat protein